MELMTVKDAAKMFRVSVRTLLRLHGAGKLAFVKIGGQNRIRRTELERFLKSSEVAL